MGPQHVKKVLVIGLDCATPQFVFGADAFDLPNLRALGQRGMWGRLESCHPPITVPAWACMLSGKDPGALGIYGFRNRRDHSYEGMSTANALAVREPRVWDILSRHGKKCVVLGVPQTYPPRPLNGWLVADFLTPDTSVHYTYPKALREELEQALDGEYILDVKDFRTEEKDGLLQRVHALMENRFRAARYLMQSKPWDFFMMVEMGVDRIHHGFWRFCDPAHPKHVPGNPYEHAIRDYYRAVDARIGDLIALAGEETAVMVVSDHGAKAMRGGVCLNQWLIERGYMAVKDVLSRPKRIEDCEIDWPRTRAWGAGGYYGRVFLNVAGREPQGLIPASEYESFRDTLAGELASMTSPDGSPLGNRVHKPEDLYRRVEGIAPDLFVYFGDLSWRSVGTVGLGGVFTFENDTGPDDANHDYHGIVILDAKADRGGVEVQGAHLMDVAPTILRLFEVDPPRDMQGVSIL